MHTTLDFTKLKPAVYNRKSTEDEDRQVLSIESQMDEANRIAEYYKLPSFVTVFKESKSAKTEGVRPEFTRMVSMIVRGEIDTIVCWKADRLARNMTEGGIIIDLLSSGILKAIITHDKVFYPWDNVMLLSIEFSQGKQYVKELSTSVKRGQNKKASMGIPHGVASLGFLNDKTEEKGNRTWLVDETRFNKIGTLLSMFLTGTYSAGKLHRYAIQELKLTTVSRKRSGGKLIVSSRIYEILKDPIYAGFFFQNGQRYELSRKLPRLINEDQHIKIKMILAKKNIPKIQNHLTTFAGFIIPSDGGSMGQDIKYQLICDCKKKFAYRSRTHCPSCEKKISELSNPKYLGYTHYYNVKKKKQGIPYRSISDSKVTDVLVDYVDAYLNFSPELVEWSKKYIGELKDMEVAEKVNQQRDREARKAEFEKKKARAREMLRDNQISSEEYQQDLEMLAHSYSDTDDKKDAVDWYSQMIEIADLTSELKDVLSNGTVQAKRNILSKLGSNLVWNDEELNISNKKSINTLVEGIKLIRSNFPEFEPKNYVVSQGSKEKTEPNDPVFSTLLRG